MTNMETKILVAELKGLLASLETEVRKVSFNLAEDNIGGLIADTDTFRAYIKRIDEKVCGHIKKTFDDELF